MDLDQGQKVALATASIVTCCAGLWGVYRQSFTSRISSMKEDYDFSIDFLERLEKLPPMHELSRQKGFRILAGDRRLSTIEAEYLTSLEAPLDAMEDYSYAKNFLDFDKELKKIIFNKFYCNQKFRAFLKFFYITLFLIFYFSPFSTVVAWGIFHLRNDISLQTFLTTLPLLLPAFLMITSANKLQRANKLVIRQSVRPLRETE